MLANLQRVLRIGSVLILLSAFACTSSPADPDSHNGAEAAGQGAAAGRGTAAAGAGQGAAAGKAAAGGQGAAAGSSTGSAGKNSQTQAGRAAAGSTAAGSTAAGSGGASTGQDAGPDDVDAAVSCDGQIVPNQAGCLQDDAFCEPLGDGRYCTGPRAPQNPPSMKQCGARAGDTCLADEYCAYEPGQYCGQADAQATCQKRPSRCAGPSGAVCGCDQRTYQSACEANKAGTGVYAAGACK